MYNQSILFQLLVIGMIMKNIFRKLASIVTRKKRPQPVKRLSRKAAFLMCAALLLTTTSCIANSSYRARQPYSSHNSSSYDRGGQQVSDAERYDMPENFSNKVKQYWARHRYYYVPGSDGLYEGRGRTDVKCDDAHNKITVLGQEYNTTCRYIDRKTQKPLKDRHSVILVTRNGGPIQQYVPQ